MVICILLCCSMIGFSWSIEYKNYVSKTQNYKYVYAKTQ